MVVTVFISCQGEKGQPPQTAKDPQESLEKANRYLVKSEKQDIENYIRRHGWDMKETGSGLRYMIYEKGEGPTASRGNVAVLEYTCWLINGQKVYSSENDGLKTFLVGRGGVESGLEEAILLLGTGDKARIILPSHLAYGLLGDDKKIPPRTAIVYDLELIELK
jgi:FKBP-type peptidyl-prolyl cis-trans isomerase